ncbi:hypothetical protein D9M68_980760 [compost metagenome]
MGSSTPLQFTTAYSNTANSRLAAGPAATMAARERRGWVLKARWRSAASTGASRSSSMRTYPPNGKAHSTNSVGLPFLRHVSSGFPKPTENRSTFTPQATATR